MTPIRWFLPGAVVVAAGCATGRGRPAPVAEAPAAGDCCGRAVLANGLRIAQRYRVAAITTRKFSHAEYWAALAPSLASPDLRTDSIGQSMLGRVLRTVTFGTGPVRVLLWSQMHGDESTASMALADIFRFLAEAGEDPLRARLRDRLTVVFVPMLNPDGAELFQRENAAGIDVNRDARRLATPEGRALKSVHDRFQPAFGFNLHDQGARTRVGATGLQSAIALLAPAFDSARSWNASRSRARLVAATLAELLGHEIAGRVAKYDDTFNPRAFGDLMERWGTSTVLIESGALPADPGKQRLRSLNVAAILGALDAIATGSYAAADPAAYEKLPYNMSGASDLLISGGQLVLPGQPPLAADIAVNYEDAVARTGGRVRDVGDLQGAIALDTVDAGGLYIHPDPSMLTAGNGGSWLRIGARAALDIRRGADRSSELVRHIGGS